MLRGPHDVLYLLAHELMHLVRADYQWPRSTFFDAYVANIAADALNDAWLTGPACEGFFGGAEALPSLRGCENPIEALLLPHAAVAEIVGLEPGSDTSEGDMAQASRKLFQHHVPAPENADIWNPSLWAATHHALQCGGRDGSMGLADAVPLVERVVKQVLPHPGTQQVEYAEGRMKSPRHLRSLAGRRGVDGSLASSGVRHEGLLEVAIPGLAAPLRALERFVRAFAHEDAARHDPEGAHNCNWHSDVAASRLGARSTAEYAAGLRATPFARREVDAANGAATIELYLDVSGSMMESLPPLLATVGARLADVCGAGVRMFSTRIEPLSWALLRVGAVMSTGGTSFDVVAEDMLARGTRRAVVVSDGLGEAVDGRLLERLRRSGVRLALVFPERIRKHPLESLCQPGFKLELKGGRA
jgi:hypothetical protein